MANNNDGMTNSKNVGAIASLFVSTIAPTNTRLIWFDDSPNQKVHKVWSTYLKQWVLLSPSNIVQLTYAELRNLASNTGLTFGMLYVIRDMNNTLATVLTSTKVMYVDSAGNIIIDDLGVNRQYHVTSSNITFDGFAPAFNETKLTLDWEFIESTFTGDDYLYGRKRVDINKDIPFKTKIKNLISTQKGNSLTFNINGFYVNVNNILEGMVDKEDQTGVVSQKSFNLYKETVDKSFDNIKSYFLDKGEKLGLVKDSTLATNVGNYRMTNDGINRVFVNGIATVKFTGGETPVTECKVQLIGSSELPVRYNASWNIDAIPVLISHKHKDGEVSENAICNVNAFLSYNDTNATTKDYSLTFQIPSTIVTPLTGDVSWDFYFSYNYETVVTPPTKKG